jgi:hypothetical protein
MKPEKPEKKKHINKRYGIKIYSLPDEGYNHACDDYEKWLPNADELHDIISHYCSAGDAAKAIRERLEK